MLEKVSTQKQRVLIVGAGVAGKELLDQLIKYPSLGYQVVGFVDDDPRKQGRSFQDIKVIGKTSQLQGLIEKNEVESVFIAIPSAQGSLIRNIINSCQKAKVTFRIVPRILEMIQGKVNLDIVRPVILEDILGRAILKSNQKILKKIFQNKRILITGAAGSIGSELSKQLVQFLPEQLICYDWWENGLFELRQEILHLNHGVEKKFIIGSIQDSQKLEWVFAEFKPQIVFHAAAFKHVPLMEDHPEEAVKNNIYGTQVCAELAGKYGAERFIFISTDKAVNPTSVMGATKSFAELILRNFDRKFSTKFISVRFGNVIGSHGSVMPIFQKQIIRGGPITITHPEMTRFFMTIPEAVQLILQAVRMGKGGEIFVLDMGEPIKILDLAKTMIRLAGFKPDVDIKIDIIGKRPGEKIFEEVLTAGEKIEKTAHKLVYVTKNILEIKEKDLMVNYEKMVSLANEQKGKEIIKTLKQILPAYR